MLRRKENELRTLQAERDSLAAAEREARSRLADAVRGKESAATAQSQLLHDADRVTTELKACQLTLVRTSESLKKEREARATAESELTAARAATAGLQRELDALRWQQQRDHESAAIQSRQVSGFLT